MSLILQIDTASEKAHVGFARNGTLVDFLSNESQKDHAGFLQTAIGKLAGKTGIQLPEIDAVAVTAGPGSYTGLRVGLASAKGICYALNKPLITMSTLEVLTLSAFFNDPLADASILYGPMMDARRMEVFTAVYRSTLEPVLEPHALVLDDHAFENVLNENTILFFGNGSVKWQTICTHKNARFDTVSLLPGAMSKQADLLFSEKKFTELAYSEPMYLKEFQIVTPK